MVDLRGRHGVVTGGGRGIGRAVAAALSQAGATVTVIGRGEATLKDAVVEGAAAGYAVADVTDEAALARALRDAATARGPIDILVPNAGAAETAPFAKAEPAQFRRLFELNVMGVVHAMRAVIGDMTARRFGRIVVIASTAGLRGAPYIAAYAASKHAVLGLVRSVALETVGNGITVNAVCPSYVDTDMVRGSAERVAATTGRSSADIVAAILKDKPLGRLIRPEEVAEAVLYFCAPGAAAVTGTTLTIAGGEV